MDRVKTVSVPKSVTTTKTLKPAWEEAVRSESMALALTQPPGTWAWALPRLTSAGHGVGCGEDPGDGLDLLSSSGRAGGTGSKIREETPKPWL